MIVIRNNRVGRPLAVSMRDQIASLLQAGKSRRSVAAELRLAKRTVDKYAKYAAVKISAQV
jgi:hypothetical protein